jgi:hypothetical protein
LERFLFDSLQDVEQPVVLTTVKALEQFCHSCSSEKTPVKLSQEWWYILLTRLAEIWFSDFFAIRAVCCQLLSHIPNQIFSEMPVDLSKVGSDDEPVVEYWHDVCVG